MLLHYTTSKSYVHVNFESSDYNWYVYDMPWLLNILIFISLKSLSCTMTVLCSFLMIFFEVHVHEYVILSALEVMWHNTKSKSYVVVNIVFINWLVDVMFIACYFIFLSLKSLSCSMTVLCSCVMLCFEDHVPKYAMHSVGLNISGVYWMCVWQHEMLVHI